jgi:hypothetical protein
MKKCEFCDEQLAIFIEWDENLCCDPLLDKYSCLKCPSSTTFVYTGNCHIGYEYWVVKERNADGYAIKSHRLCIGLTTSDDGKPAYSLEIKEWRERMQPRTIYKNIVDYLVTPTNAEQKIKTILTFM